MAVDAALFVFVCVRVCVCAWWLRRVRSQALLETGRVARFAATGPPQGEGVAGDVPFRDGGGSVVLVCLLLFAELTISSTDNFVTHHMLLL